jgi:hypothetical protein
MKKLIVILLLLIVGTASAIEGVYTYSKEGVLVQPGQKYTVRNTWTTLDDTSAAGAEPVDLVVGSRTRAEVSAGLAGPTSTGSDETTIFNIPASWNIARIRCIGVTDAGSATYQIYLGTLGVSGNSDCDLVKVAQLAFMVGTQLASTLTSGSTTTYEYADTLAVSATQTGSFVARSTNNATAIIPDVVYTSPANNTVAEARILLHGADIMVIVPTVITSDSILLGKGE